MTVIEYAVEFVPLFSFGGICVSCEDGVLCEVIGTIVLYYLHDERLCNENHPRTMYLPVDDELVMDRLGNLDRFTM